MNSEREIKDQVSQLLRSGQRGQAKLLLQSKLGISDDEAEKLVRALEQENPAQHVVIPGLTRGVNTISQTGGCVALFLRGFGLFFTLITLACYAFAVIMYFYYNNFVSEEATVTGTVIDFEVNAEGGSAPMVEYDWNGETKVYKSAMYSTPPDYAPGDSVTLYVNPENPDEAIINSFAERYLFSVIFAGVGTFFLFFAIAMFVIARKLRTGFDKSR
jgi:hypothetical protein